VAELHAVLSNAGESGPYTLVGHSLGGNHIRLYAGRYPADVIGMVLVDARHEDVDSAIPRETLRLENEETSQFRELEVWLRRLGVTRALGPCLAAAARPDVRGLPPFHFVQRGNPAAAEANISEISSYLESNAQLHAEAGSLGDMPVVVLMRGGPITNSAYWSARQASQRTMAGLSTRGQLIVAEYSGHTIQLEQPELVVGAVRQVLSESR
jgi:pimeloyl-ACP methyl ester carboxylesterase